MAWQWIVVAAVVALGIAVFAWWRRAELPSAAKALWRGRGKPAPLRYFAYVSNAKLEQLFTQIEPPPAAGFMRPTVVMPPASATFLGHLPGR